MVRNVPSIARKERNQDKKQQTPFLEQARLTLARELLEQATPKQTGRPPKTDQEKRETYQALALLRNARMTYEECAQRLGVSVSSVRNYIADPFFQEVQADMAQQSRAAGFVSVGALVQDAIATMIELMRDAKSEFVRYKAAEQITRLAGMEEPQQALQRDDTRDVGRVLEAIRLRALAEQTSAPQPAQVQVTINMADPATVEQVVESVSSFSSSATTEEDGEDLYSLIERRQLREQQHRMRAEYEEPLLPGGHLPGGSARPGDPGAGTKNPPGTC